MKYLVIIETAPSSIGAYVPDLPGCIAVGDTEDEVRDLMREAIAMHVEDLVARGEPVPPASSASEYIEVVTA